MGGMGGVTKAAVTSTGYKANIDILGALLVRFVIESAINPLTAFWVKYNCQTYERVSPYATNHSTINTVM
jgi:hypothetical protein